MRLNPDHADNVSDLILAYAPEAATDDERDLVDLSVRVVRFFARANRAPVPVLNRDRRQMLAKIAAGNPLVPAHRERLTAMLDDLVDAVYGPLLPGERVVDRATGEAYTVERQVNADVFLAGQPAGMHRDRVVRWPDPYTWIVVPKAWRERGHEHVAQAAALDAWSRDGVDDLQIGVDATIRHLMENHPDTMPTCLCRTHGQTKAWVGAHMRRKRALLLEGSRA